MNSWKRLVVVGVGLIGGSVGLAARTRRIARKVVGVGSSHATLETALRVGAIDQIADTAAEAAADADLVVVCAPVGKIVEQVREFARHCSPGTVITDAGSTKADIVGRVTAAISDEAWRPGVAFVGSHPLAGNEKRGPQFASADLFVGRTVVVTPNESTAPAACDQVVDFWQCLGADTIRMSPERHDRALAYTSHLPHLAASAIAGTTPEEYVTLTASGWQDTTRIAAGSPDLWRQILLANRENLLAALDPLQKNLDEWRAALAAGDAAAIERLLTEGKRIRDAVGN